jgi:glycosyltransferase involved in cell wall biosynthesis
MPQISVLLPVYNGEAFVRKAIESVLAQTYGDFEFIIVDNASTDNTNSIAREYLRDRRVKLYRNEETIHIVENFSKVFSYASAESRWLKYIGADDFFYPACLQEMLRVAALDPRVGLVSAQCYDGERLLAGAVPRECEIVSGPVFLRRLLLEPETRETVFSPSTVMMLKEAFKQKGGFRKELYHTDTELFYLILNDYDLGFVHQPLCYSGRRPRSSMSKSMVLGTLQSEAYEIFYRNLARYTRVKLTPREVEKIKYERVRDSTGFLINKLRHGHLRIAFFHLKQIPVKTIYYFPLALLYYFGLSVKKLVKKEPFKLFATRENGGSGS